MALAITTEQEQLAEAVSRFAARHAPIGKTRAAFDSIAAGELPSWWEEFTAHGFHAVHLPEDAGGQGGTLADMACVVEAAAAALLPGPLLSTVTTSAIAAVADASAAALMTDLAGGATAATVLPGHSDVRAVRRGDDSCSGDHPARRWGSLAHNASYVAARPDNGVSPLVRAGRAVAGDGPHDRTAARHRLVHRCGGAAPRRPHRCPRVRGVRAFRRTRPLHCSGARGRARRPGRCTGAPMWQSTTSELASSSASPSAPFRLCSTRPPSCR